MPMTADDLVVGIFYYLKKNKKTKLTADREKLHQAFFRATREYPKIMSVLSFRNREQFPESAQLDQALSNLDATSIISRQNLTPRYYHLENSLDNSYDKFSKNILINAGIQENDLNNLAVSIKDLL